MADAMSQVDRAQHQIRATSHRIDAAIENKGYNKQVCIFLVFSLCVSFVL